MAGVCRDHGVVARFLGAAVLCCLPWHALAAERYPSKPIRIIVPSSPSSGPDIIARLTGNVLTEAWGQQVVADNRAGAAGNIGGELAARAIPDGYTLFAASSQQVSGPLYNDKAGYHLQKDFAPIVLTASTAYALSVHPAVPANSMRELLALSKAKPGALQFGSSGTGGGPHLAVELLKLMSGFSFTHIPYKAATFALLDVAGGQVQFTFTVLPAVLPMMKIGKVRTLAVTSRKRTPLAPELEAIAETVPGYEAIGWYGLVAPARTPQTIITALNAEIIKALKTPEVVEKIRSLGADPIGGSPQEFSAFISEQIDITRKIIDAAGLRGK
jgi:tripartite-type tricarboxylate transporter receptor subunit TctC